MDYEKMYKEALERAKKFEEKYGGGYAEYIFPELAESEDERIRKELKEAFEAYDIESKWNGIPIRSIFAWLEKQKEQKPNYCHYGGDPSVERCKYCSAACSARLTEEQKPKAKAKSPLSPHELYDAKIEGISQGRQDVLDHPEQFGLQKPAEWSEEDEHNLNSVISLVHSTSDGAWGSCVGDRIENWLKSLRPQYHGDVTMTEAYKMGLEAGKASSWKPSEEQMEAFKKYIEEFQARAAAAVGGWNNFDVMIRLYEQLKKL